MILALSVGIIATAITYSLIPIFGVAVSVIGISVFISRQKAKREAIELSKNPFQKRAHSSGGIYVAESRSSGWMKIGFTSKDPKERERTLNQVAEGGQRDWLITVFKVHRMAGRLEILAHDKLKALKVASKETAERKNKATGRGSREIFRLDVKSAEDAIRSSERKLVLRLIEKNIKIAAFVIIPIILATILALILNFKD
jgi:hypothetical protein